MATPIAHKGSLAGAKVVALSLIDLITQPQLVQEARDYFRDVQTKEVRYIPFISDKDPSPTYLNKEVMDKFRPAMKAFYYDASKYKTYLDQLGIKYPTLEKK